jgi:hypothetical protein
MTISIRPHVIPFAAIVLCLPTAVHAFPGGGMERAQDQLRAADKNGDGAVSRAEFIEHRASQWSKMDRNGDGYFSKADLPSFAQSRWDGERLADLRRQFDTDGDGRLSRAELVSGPTPVFDAADRDNNNIVTKAEMQAAAKRAQAAR